MTNQESTRLMDLILSEIKENHLIVTPDLYSEIFFKMAKKLNLDLKNNINDRALLSQFRSISESRKESSKNVKMLSEKTENAIGAISNSDELLLKQTFDEIQSLKEKINTMSEKLFEDDITDFKNKYWFFNSFLENDSFECDGVFSIVDIDNYTNIINKYGFSIGTAVLRKFSQLIYSYEELFSLLSGFVRIGGDEFFLIFKSGVSISEAERVLGNFRLIVESKTLNSGDISFKISFSFGTSEFNKGDSYRTVFNESRFMLIEDELRD